MIIPTLAICLEVTIPVEAAIAFEGVEIGSVIAKEAQIATKGIISDPPPMALLTTIIIGIIKAAEAEFEMKLLNP